VSVELREGSCLDPATGLASLPDKSVDHVITDPPYEAEAHSKGRRAKPGGWRQAQYGAGDGRAVEEAPLPFAPMVEDDRLAVAAHFGRVARRWILVFCQVEASQMWADALIAGGVQYVRTMVWVKPDAQPQLTGDRPGMGYESIVVAHRQGRKRWNGGGRVGVFVHNKSAGRPAGEKAPHPTTKPLPLMRELVDLFTDTGDLIVDPYAGSGTTGVACRQLGRSFLGWELDAGYAEIARRRLAGEEAKPNAAQPSLFDIGGSP
jgi:DNA modification methylase